MYCDDVGETGHPGGIFWMNQTSAGYVLKIQKMHQQTN